MTVIPKRFVLYHNIAIWMILYSYVSIYNYYMDEIQLTVPLIQVPRGSKNCQIGTTLMLLAFYNDPMSYEELVSVLKPYMIEGGMHSQGPALFFTKRNYQTFFAHHDLGVLTPPIENYTEKDIATLEAYLSEIEKTDKNAYQIEKLTLDISYIKSGGRYSTRLPDLDTVDRYLHEGIPVALGVRYKALHLLPTAGNANHSIIVTGKNRGEYLVNDPDPQTGGEYKISRDRLLHAWYNTGVQLTAVWKEKTPPRE